ncbi:MAG: AraC family transcriptional regulator [Caldilinea sp. CFX5]|nr:AraC family transcriptional regulator [Caldilinea sp. CFX5]
MTKQTRKNAMWLHGRAVLPVVAALKVLGYDADALLKRCNITQVSLADADTKIAHQAMMHLWQEAQAVTGDDYLGIHLAEAAPIDSFGLHTYAVLSSPTLREAYCRACRYQRLIHTVTNLRYYEQSTEGVLEHGLPGGSSIPRHPAEFLVTLWVRFGRLILGDDFSPTLVCFAHDSSQDTSEYDRVFQTTVQFHSGRTAIHLPNHLLDMPSTKADVGLTRVLDDYAMRLLAGTPTNATFSEHVRLHLLDELNGGVPTADRMAQALHLSVRTLHRNLSQEGTTFRALLRQVRHEQATRHLANPQISIAEVAFLLGFTELSSFYRAFKGWTGVTPAEYRATTLGNRTIEPG